MMTGKLGMVGAPPKIVIDAGNPEAIKYGQLWNTEEYRRVSPGESLAQIFLTQAHPRLGAEVIDFGCGTGRGALTLALLGGLRVTMIDFVSNCLDLEIKQALTTQAHALKFIKADLERPIPAAAEYGFCGDVMEHIPPDRVGQTLDNILKAARHVFFSISTVEDGCGQLIGEKLHLTVRPYEWWLERFRERECVIHWSQDLKNGALFYVTAWQDAQTIVDAGKLNVTESQIRANVAINCASGWQQASPHELNDFEVMILGGGPSLAEHENEIKRMRADGVKLLTINGTYNWCLERGLVPSVQVVVDARPFNARFTHPVVPDCRYLIASQCDPSVFEGLPKDRTYIWHTAADSIKDILDEAYNKIWWPIPGGSTALLRAIPLMRMLGYRKFHLFGCDSCLADDKHHAYAQPENDSDFVIPVQVTGGRIFHCHLWMAGQAQEMISLIKFFGDEIELDIHGDGLLAHILNTGAEMFDLDLERSI